MKRGNRLRELRELYGIVQQELVVEAGVSGSTLVAIEKHNLYPAYQETRDRIVGAMRRLSRADITESDIWPESEPILDPNEPDLVDSI